MLSSIGRYQIQEQIGSGSMGQVYRAVDTTLGRDIALKAIQTGPTLDPDLKERFYREARLCARLQHPNIVTVYDMGEADGHAYIAMELLQGRNLKNLIDEETPFPLKEKVVAIAQAAEGLAYAHRSGLVHRDLKPSNLFRTDLGQVKILDFGIARMPASMLTVAGVVLGTPNYMAPEQILGQTLDGRADLFSLAIALFLWISHEHPFRADSIPKRIASQMPDRLIDMAPFIGPELDAVLAKALSRNPGDRYQTGDELALALRHAVAESSSELLSASQPAPAVMGAGGNVASVDTGKLPEPPPDEEAAELRISRFLQALQEFDEAYDVRAVGVAAEALRTVEQLASEDGRFKVAATEYRSRLQELELAQKPVMPAPAVYKSEPARPIVAELGAAPKVSNPIASTPLPAAPFPLDLSDATRLLASPVMSAPAIPSIASPVVPAMEKAVLPQEVTRKLQPASEPGPSLAHANVSAGLYGIPSKPNAADTKPIKPVAWRNTGPLVLKVAGGLAVCGALFLLIGPFLRGKSFASAASFGTAEISTDSARVMSGINGDGRIIKELVKGEKVNLLTYRLELRSGWAAVQYVSGGRALEAGYLPLSSLSNWSRLNFVQAFDPGPSAQAEQRARYIAELEAFLKFAPSEDVVPARQEIAREKALAEQRYPAASATDAPVEILPGASSSRAASAQDSPAPVEAAYSPDQDFARADSAFEGAEYERAKRALGRILKHDPSNSRARSFLARALAAQKLDPGVK